jgi:hypothetical protein
VQPKGFVERLMADICGEREVGALQVAQMRSVSDLLGLPHDEVGVGCIKVAQCRAIGRGKSKRLRGGVGDILTSAEYLASFSRFASICASRTMASTQAG